MLETHARDTISIAQNTSKLQNLGIEFPTLVSAMHFHSAIATPREVINKANMISSSVQSCPLFASPACVNVCSK